MVAWTSSRSGSAPARRGSGSTRTWTTRSAWCGRREPRRLWTGGPRGGGGPRRGTRTTACSRCGGSNPRPRAREGDDRVEDGRRGGAPLPPLRALEVLRAEYDRRRTCREGAESREGFVGAAKRPGKGQVALQKRAWIQDIRVIWIWRVFWRSLIDPPPHLRYGGRFPSRGARRWRSPPSLAPPRRWRTVCPPCGHPEGPACLELSPSPQCLWATGPARRARIGRMPRRFASSTRTGASGARRASDPTKPGLANPKPHPRSACSGTSWDSLSGHLPPNEWRTGPVGNPH